MAVKTYGSMKFDIDANKFIIEHCEPHISIKLKSIFAKVAKTSKPPYGFHNTDQNCTDLLWFMERYPLAISPETSKALADGKKYYVNRINEIEALMLPDYKASNIVLKGGFEARDYQVKAKEVYLKVQRLLLGDDLGLGKTLTSILSLLHWQTLPAAVVVQTHMPTQWQTEGIEKFTNLKVHKINKTTPYNLPVADVYIFKYSQLAGWTNFFQTGFFKSAIFDEVQELRRSQSNKYYGGKALSESVSYCMGLSATPIYNYGDEIFNVLDLVNPGCLGERYDFLREWAVQHGENYKISDPKALGSFLRENHLFLRRTRAEVGRELPPVNKIIHTVGYDEHEVMKSAELAKTLAMKVMSGGFEVSGQAARELDMLARHTTGVSKAREVASYVRILLENDEPVVLAGWHRDVYDIWLHELAEYNPVMYTGTESGKQKEDAKAKFISGESKLFIISLRSGAGLDGLQFVCKTIVVGELDWSPKVHDQLIGRVDRDGQPEQVTAIFLVSDSGSDPVIIDLLGLKASQSNGIVDPLKGVEQQFSDESRMKILAKQYLGKQSA
ncbi:SNF2-related protein [Pedobacter agri]|uniref:SNF2-related protein n=1 Tax=Pedobacter agri TaxID=454586 RepID=UPI00292DAE3A|nr:SNF2-related protein [Pedobacter agri]